LRHEVWIAERGGHLVGWTTFGTSRDRDTDASVAEIHGLYVDPEWWGAGVGSRLIELAHSRLSVPPVERVTLWVLTQNHRAIEFYMKRGFRADGAKGVYERDDLRLPQMRMSRPAADTGASI
jgi:GNAT superfamily N-acetyltransferase